MEEVASLFALPGSKAQAKSGSGRKLRDAFGPGIGIRLFNLWLSSSVCLESILLRLEAAVCLEKGRRL